MKEERKYRNQGGRKPKADPRRHRYVFYLSNKDNAEFLSRFEQSGLKIKAHFITASLFNSRLKVVKIDKAAFDYYIKLTEFYSQFRAIGVNYNQAVKAVKTAFSEKKALAFLYKLEKATLEMAGLNQKVIDLTHEFENYLQNESP